jgi:hypothetical protein
LSTRKALRERERERERERGEKTNRQEKEIKYRKIQKKYM